MNRFDIETLHMESENNRFLVGYQPFPDTLSHTRWGEFQKEIGKPKEPPAQSIFYARQFFRKYRNNMNQPQAPEYLDEIAREQWRLKIAVLSERGDITTADYTNLELYCVNYSLYRKAVQNIAERGFSITNSQGTEARNPALSAKSEAEKIIVKMSSLLGFDPVSRQKTPIETEEKDELDNL